MVVNILLGNLSNVLTSLNFIVSIKYTSYTCRQHDVPSGDIIQVKTGDEIAINYIAFEVVDLDGSGNGKGIVKVPMFNGDA